MSAAAAFPPDPSADERDVAPLESLAGLLAVVLVEVLEGHRPALQLERLVTPAVALRIRHWVRINAGRRSRDAGRPAAAPRVRSVRCQRRGHDAAEAAVVIDQGGRSRAIAVRFDRQRGEWIVTDLAPVEGGLPAIATSRLRFAPAPRDAFDETASSDVRDDVGPDGDPDGVEEDEERGPMG